MVPIILFLAIGAVALGAWSASTALEARTGARRSLRAIENYEIVDVREQEMLESVTDRLVAPVGRKLLDIGRTFTPVGYVEKLKRNIVLAGNPPGYEVDRLIVWKVLGVASGIVWLPLTYTFLSGHILIMLLAITFAWGLSVFGPLADANVNVDMIVQNVSEDGRFTDLTFTVSRADFDRAIQLLNDKKAELGYERLMTDKTVVKVSVIGVGMRSHAGVAQRMFQTLADKGINIQVISTSEIKVSVLIAADYTELAVRALHTAYELDATA